MQTNESSGSDEHVPSLNPPLPFVYPESRVLAAICTYGQKPPWRSVLAAAKSFFGIAHGIDGEAAELLRELLTASSDLYVRLAIAVYPACPTGTDTLESLVSLSDEFCDRADFRLVLSERDEERPANMLCVLSKSDTRPVFLIGPSGNLGLNAPRISQVNLAFQGDGESLEQCRNWFNLVWCRHAIPLHRATTCIPPLVPAQGDDAAAIQWGKYFRLCQAAVPLPEGDGELIPVVVDAETGETELAAGASDSAELPSERIGVAVVDPATRKITAILGQGSLATIDQSSRIPPLDCPVKPEWFGVDSFTQYGAVVREVKFRISAIDESTLKKLNAFRHKTRHLLSQLSLPWAERLHWIPNEAKPLLHGEMERLNDEGLELLKGTLGSDVKKYLADRMDRIRRDAQSMYQHIHPNKELADAVVDQILQELKHRLEKAIGGQLLARVCYTEVQTGVSTDSRWSTPWGQYALFLSKLIEFPRKCLTDKYALRGLKLEADEVLKAMDVAGDHLVQDHFADKRVDRIAVAELDQVRELMAYSDDRQKCAALLRLLGGKRCPQLAFL